jgi:hypothetical protein
LGVKEERNFVLIIKRRKANCTGHMLHTNRLIKHVTEGNIEVKRRREKGVDSYWVNLGAGKGRYWNLRKKALDRTVWRTRFGRGYRLVAILGSA